MPLFQTKKQKKEKKKERIILEGGTDYHFIDIYTPSPPPLNLKQIKSKMA